ncbi:hypothetical protein TREES_T100007256 [Tupaia chinensis]|uniref:Uncharacterized protein n=1 Tax=Tupaia chinensis TaxID=246437 RepID=L9L5L6_TUPCH|nr:hypothetical protein TREES_T100007256 [Tupaia chinensis]
MYPPWKRFLGSSNPPPARPGTPADVPCPRWPGTGGSCGGAPRARREKVKTRHIHSERRAEPPSAPARVCTLPEAEMLLQRKHRSHESADGMLVGLTVRRAGTPAVTRPSLPLGTHDKHGIPRTSSSHVHGTVACHSQLPFVTCAHGFYPLTAMNAAAMNTVCTELVGITCSSVQRGSGGTSRDPPWSTARVCMAVLQRRRSASLRTLRRTPRYLSVTSMVKRKP